MDEAGHLLQAQHNARLSQYLDVDATEFVDWHIIATFYEALHYVDALNASEGGAPFHDHRERLQFVSSTLPAIYDEYQFLYELSCDARYKEVYSSYQNNVSRQTARRLRTDELERIKQAVRSRGVAVP